MLKISYYIEMSVPYNWSVGWTHWLPYGSTTMKSNLEKDSNTTTDTDINFFFYLRLLSLAVLDTIDVFSERGISTLDDS